MKAPFHYAVKVKLIRFETKDAMEFVHYDKVFEDENPIIAQGTAFIEYEEWIKDLYEGMGSVWNNQTHKQAKIDLQRFITPSNRNRITINENLVDFEGSINYGIGVYFIIDQPYSQSWESDSMSDKVGDEYLIHGIGTTENYNDPLELSTALNTEILYYEHYNFDKGHEERHTKFYDHFLGDIETIRLLQTPFDWTGLDRQPETDSESPQTPSEKYEKIISGGEGNQVEFKPALLFNFKTGKAGISIKQKIAVAICAFLNANGGFLFIGLDDDGIPQGLDNDFSLSGSKKPKDFFQNEFDQMIEYFLSFSVKSNINGEFYNLRGKDIFVVTVEPSKNRAIFLKKQNAKEFWIRGNAGNRQLTDMEELAKYCIDRWGK